ncbi:ATP-binding protein [Paenibacillus sp. GCM10028914]|uniref:HAMP domain-containing sensor histidine kinase n=1 Tax=Paenibacillus sp. GCM10028914 TaxID=3273416 RepID=UPI00361B189B
MRTRKIKSLWWYFVSHVFLIMLLTCLIMTPVAYFVIHYGNLTSHGRFPFAPILIILLFSVAIGTLITSIVGKRILAPITNFSKATNEIAKGNFEIELDESHWVNEISDMAIHFNRMVRELRSIETLRTDFVVNVSHEFRTPLASIEGYTMLLQDHSLSEAERDEYTKVILDSAQQLSTLSGNILKLSKLENQELIIEKKTYRLDEQIRQAILLLEPQWSSKDLELNIELMKVHYEGNEELVMQVWLNLMGNAIKFTPDGGEITVSLTNDTNYITVHISDTGIGMSEDVQKHMFEKFYQGDNARYAEGNGLGLPLVRRIIDLCGGKIEVQSECGCGTTFTIQLPL